MPLTPAEVSAGLALLSTIHNTPIMIAGISADGVITIWNPECTRVTGWDSDEMVGQHFVTKITSLTGENSPDLQRAIAERLEMLLRGAPEIEHRIHAKDGSYHAILWRTVPSPMLLPDTKWYGLGIDVTAERTQLAQLQAAERRYDHLLRSFPDLILEVDSHGVISFVNTDHWAGKIADRDAIDLTPSAVIGQNALEIFSGYIDQIENAHELLGQVNQYGNVASFTQEWATNGEQFSREIRLIPTETGRITVIVRDTTDQTRILAAERDQHTLTEVLGAVGMAITSTLDTDAIFDRIFEQSARVLPRDGVNIVLLNAEGLLDLRYYKGDYLRFETDLSRMRKPAEVFGYRMMIETHAPLIIPDTENDPRWTQANEVLSYAGAPLISKGEVIGFLNLDSFTPGTYDERYAERLGILATYVTIALENARLYEATRQHAATLEDKVAQRTRELQIANEKLHSLDRVKSKLIDDISHELRTPLTTISAQVYLIEHGDPGRRDEHLTALRSQVRQLIDLTNSVISYKNLLETTGSKFSDADDQASTADLKSVVDNFVRATESYVSRAGLTLELYIAPDLPPVAIKPDDLAEIVQHLTLNALVYTHEGTIMIRAYRGVPDGITLEVEDTGVGISAADLPHVFEPFYRGMSSGSLNVPGSGLGLSTVHKLAELYGGTIEAEADRAVGSLFRVWLPSI